MRRKINMTIVFLSTVLAGILWIFNVGHLIPVAAFMIVYNIVSLIYYRETRLIIAYHIVTMFVIIGFFVSISGMIQEEEIYLLFRAFFDVGGLALFIISFGIILQNKTRLSIERVLMTVTVYNFIFYTNNRYTLLGYLVGFFKTNQDSSVTNVIVTFNIVNYVFILFIALTQVYLIHRFDERLTRQIHLHKKRLEKIEDKFY